MRVYFGTDHAGFEMKNQLLAYVRDELKYEVEDCGTFAYDAADDYPVFVGEAARKLSADALAGKDSCAIVAGASGQGEAMVANRFKGVRCALYYGKAGTQTDMSGKQLDMIASTREHNHANALSLGLRFLSFDEAKAVVKQFLSVPYSPEERHIRRIKMIDELN